MKWIRSPWLFRLYGLFPHHLLNRLTRWGTTVERPRWYVQWVIRRWIRDKQINMDDFEAKEYRTIEEFFLRRLVPGARPFEEGFMAPVDGRWMGSGVIKKDTILQVKGMPISLESLVNGKQRLHSIPLDAYEGGSYLTIFLTPNGYHRIHMPEDGCLLDVQWIPGRFFPQNEDAVHSISRIYERNERAVLRILRSNGEEYLAVLVGASLIGGIHLTSIPREEWVHRTSVKLERKCAKGDEVAHFSFGSTIVLLFPNASVASSLAKEPGEDVRLGETLFELET